MRDFITSPASEQLVARHVDLVYASALRQTHNDTHAAADVTQAVFLIALRKARNYRLPEETRMAGWLLLVTRYAVKKLRRAETRRTYHERRSQEAKPQPDADPMDAAAIMPFLDEMLLTLKPLDREVLVRRYLQGQPIANVAGALGMSENTAGRRIARAIEKLRKVLARRNLAAPAALLVAVMSTECAKAAPAALASAAVAGGASPAAVSIAKGAAVMMKMTMMKTVAAVTLAVVALAGGAVVVAENVAKWGKVAAPAKTLATEMAPAGVAEPAFPPIGIQREMMARWDVVMNQQGMDRLKKELSAIQTQSNGYQAYEADAEKIRTAIKEASAANNLLLLPQHVGWASRNRDETLTNKFADFGLWSHHLSGSITLGPKGSKHVNVTVGFMSAAAFIEPRKGAVQLKINPVDFRSIVRVTPGEELSGGPRHMQYQGDVALGKAVVFAGQWGQTDGTELWHVSIWQTFACGNEEYGYLQNTSPKEWIEAGIAGEKRVVDRAILWSGQAKHALTKVPPMWEKKLPNGAILRLAAISVPDRWRYCWWDALGQPVTGEATHHQEMDNGTNGPANGIMAMVEAEDPSVPEPGPDQQNQRRSILQQPVGKDGRVEAGASAGPWQDGAAIKVGQVLEVKGVKVKLEDVTQGLPKTANEPGSSWFRVLQTGRSDMEIQIAAFDKQGKEVPQDRMPQIFFGREQMTYDDLREQTSGVDAVPADVGSYRVRWRAISWTTFEGFAKLPVISPDKVQAESEKPAATNPAEPPTATAASPGTPEAFMQTMSAATDSGDIKKVRALMAADDPLTMRMADVMAEMAVGSNDLRVAAEKAFGPEDTQRALVATGLASPRLQPSKLKWKVEGNRAAPVIEDSNVHVAGPGGTLVRVNGQWLMDMGLSKDFTKSQRQELETQLAVMEGMAPLPAEIAKEIGKGKYKDAYAARDAMLAKRNELMTLRNK